MNCYTGPSLVPIPCPVCGTEHLAEVLGDDRGTYAELDTYPCHYEECTVQLCSSCPQFFCYACGLSHCLSHAVVIDNERYCPLCAQSDLPTPEEQFVEQEWAALDRRMAQLEGMFAAFRQQDSTDTCPF